MKFDVPRIINEEPTKELYHILFPDNKAARHFAFVTARKVYKRTRLAEAQNWHCCWCGTEMIPEPNKHNSVTVEHILPRSQGGSDEMENLAAACLHCNNKRGTSGIEDFMQKFLHKNQELRAV